MDSKAALRECWALERCEAQAAMNIAENIEPANTLGLLQRSV